jgi:hypothetical protein
LDQPTKRLISDVLVMLLILLISVLAYVEYGASGILVAGGLAITVWVAADIVLLRKS